MNTKKPAVKTRKKSSLQSSVGVVCVKATFNNTIVTITDPLGRTISWASAGKVGFSGSKKSSAHAATIASQKAGKEAYDAGLRQVEVKLKGPGGGRESAVRGLQSSGLEVSVIADVTPVPHNGCRSRKRRRV